MKGLERRLLKRALRRHTYALHLRKLCFVLGAVAVCRVEDSGRRGWVPAKFGDSRGCRKALFEIVFLSSFLLVELGYALELFVSFQPLFANHIATWCGRLHFSVFVDTLFVLSSSSRLDDAATSQASRCYRQHHHGTGGQNGRWMV